jgi:hypothetical protein
MVFNYDIIYTAIEKGSNYRNYTKKDICICPSPVQPIHIKQSDAFSYYDMYIRDDYYDNDGEPICEIALYKDFYIDKDQKIFMVLLFWKNLRQNHMDSLVERIFVSQDNRILYIDPNYNTELTSTEDIAREYINKKYPEIDTQICFVFDKETEHLISTRLHAKIKIYKLPGTTIIEEAFTNSDRKINTIINTPVVLSEFFDMISEEEILRLYSDTDPDDIPHSAIVNMVYKYLTNNSNEEEYTIQVNPPHIKFTEDGKHYKYSVFSKTYYASYNIETIYKSYTDICVLVSSDRSDIKKVVHIRFKPKDICEKIYEYTIPEDCECYCGYTIWHDGLKIYTHEPHKFLPLSYIDPKDSSLKRSAELHIEHLKLQDRRNLESKRMVYIIHPERYKRLKVRL